MEPEAQLPLETLAQRVSREAKLAYGRANMLDEYGDRNTPLLASKIYDRIAKAVVESPGERAKVGIGKEAFMTELFPQLPGKTEWVDQADPELAEKTYNAIGADVSRALASDGPVQARLNGNLGMLLCRTRRHPNVYYVTRNLKCITEDYAEPSARRATAALESHAVLMALAIERLPEHAKKFERAYDAAGKLALQSGRAKIQNALDAASSNGDDE